MRRRPSRCRCRARARASRLAASTPSRRAVRARPAATRAAMRASVSSVVLMAASSPAGERPTASARSARALFAAASASAILRLRVDQAALGVEHVERRRSAERVADRGDAVRLARGGEQLVAEVDRLAQRGARARVGRANVLRDLRLQVAIASRSARARGARSRRSRRFACDQWKKGKGKDEAGREERAGAFGAVVALWRRCAKSGIQYSRASVVEARAPARSLEICASSGRSRCASPSSSSTAGNGGGTESVSPGITGVPTGRPMRRSSASTATETSRSLAIRSFSAWASATRARMTSSRATVPPSKRACVFLRKSAARSRVEPEVVAVLDGHQQRVVAARRLRRDLLAQRRVRRLERADVRRRRSSSAGGTCRERGWRR